MYNSVTIMSEKLPTQSGTKIIQSWIASLLCLVRMLSVKGERLSGRTKRLSTSRARSRDYQRLDRCLPGLWRKLGGLWHSTSDNTGRKQRFPFHRFLFLSILHYL